MTKYENWPNKMSPHAVMTLTWGAVEMLDGSLPSSLSIQRCEAELHRRENQPRAGQAH